MEKARQVKIHFPLEVEEDNFPPISVETLNGFCQGNGAVKLDNTPFFVTSIALGDEIKYKKRKNEEGYWYDSVQLESGNKALSIIFLEAGYEEEIYQNLRSLGCYCEYGKFGAFNMLAVCVLKNQMYLKVASYLDKLETLGLISYAELCV